MASWSFQVLRNQEQQQRRHPRIHQIKDSPNERDFLWTSYIITLYFSPPLILTAGITRSTLAIGSIWVLASIQNQLKAQLGRRPFYRCMHGWLARESMIWEPYSLDFPPCVE